MSTCPDIGTALQTECGNDDIHSLPQLRLGKISLAKNLINLIPKLNSPEIPQASSVRYRFLHCQYPIVYLHQVYERLNQLKAHADRPARRRRTQKP